MPFGSLRTVATWGHFILRQDTQFSIKLLLPGDSGFEKLKIRTFTAIRNLVKKMIHWVWQGKSHSSQKETF